MNNHKYFSTDGIRGKVGDYFITPDFILKLGWAAGNVLARYGSRKVIVGKDTRISGYMLESALAAGLASAGISAVFTGPMPTPAIAYLTRAFRAEAGIVISASHNPFYDNGIKFFSFNGVRLTNEEEEAIEQELRKPLTCVESWKLGKASQAVDVTVSSYIEFCKQTFPENLSLKLLKIVVDCANGATYHIAPRVLRELGATVVALSCEPNGVNINKRCGATDIRYLQKQVLREKADLGIAYDGDGDRVIMVDHLGRKVNGDQILYVIVRERLRQGKLLNGVVGTLMSNTGLELALKKMGVSFVRTHVGDRHVFEKMQEQGWYIGAENSGHIILLDKTTTSDGIIAGLQVLSAMVSNQMNLHDLCIDMNLFPQIFINVYFSELYNPLESAAVKQVRTEVEQQLSGCGRVILRKSDTEPFIRIMVEGKNTKHVNKFAHYIADTVRDAVLKRQKLIGSTCV